MKSHTSMLGTFFVYTLALCMPVFKKKSHLKRLGKSYKLFIEVTLQQWKVWNIFPEISAKIGIHSAKEYTKNVPNIEVCDFIPALSTTLSIKQVIVVYKYIICYFSDVLASDTETTLGDTEDRILRRQRARWVKHKYDRNSIVVVRMKVRDSRVPNWKAQ